MKYTNPLASIFKPRGNSKYLIPGHSNPPCTQMGRNVMVSDGAADASRPDYDPVVTMEEPLEKQALPQNLWVDKGSGQARQEGPPLPPSPSHRPER
jgi:hypothetical protein